MPGGGPSDCHGQHSLALARRPEPSGHGHASQAAVSLGPPRKFQVVIMPQSTVEEKPEVRCIPRRSPSLRRVTVTAARPGARVESRLPRSRLTFCSNLSFTSSFKCPGQPRRPRLARAGRRVVTVPSQLTRSVARPRRGHHGLRQPTSPLGIGLVLRQNALPFAVVGGFKSLVSFAQAS
jgi:hypothetical protein